MFLPRCGECTNCRTDGKLPCTPGSRKKEYRITAAGRAAVESELARLRELVKNGEQVTGGSPV